ncbi:YiiD C-terminal domain-containing protein [Reinekea sp.]|jgi:thioesterase domain-containing protein|uniref:YiiD C-terminal domain-containing protein n=1 Tax=Reinekea sp. TaxID=1970455 RepID=UPI002A8083A0|nr:YiiD C-terminal domain-containing protein [Reinekea sp.]
MNLQAIEPLKPLGIKLLHCTETEAVFSLPLVGNRNDKATVFAGSQYSVLVLAGWYLTSTWSTGQQLGSKVAIKDSQVQYPKAAWSDLRIVARFVSPPDRRPSGHWRALLSVEARDELGELVSQFSGDYRILQS